MEFLIATYLLEILIFSTLSEMVKQEYKGLVLKQVSGLNRQLSG